MLIELALKDHMKKLAIAQTNKRENRTYNYRERPKGYYESIKSSSLVTSYYISLKGV